MPTQTSASLLDMLPMLAILVVFFLIVFLPQRKRDKKVKEMLANIQVGNNVRTIGGIYGKVVAVKEDVVTIECGPDKVKLVFSKQAIATVENAEVVNEMTDTAK
ncbi:MAG: preprotein translocase subunit YajC [Christensenellales bacterium]|jgi:preprotein translocase subunit YajC